MDHTKSYSHRLLMKGKLQTSSRPRLSGKVAAPAVGRGKCEQTREMILTCVRKLAPIASYSSALPPSAGAAND